MARGVLDIEELRAGRVPTRAELMGLVLSLSVPAILAELSSILMVYIDAAMVGSLGAEASAAIGLVETTLWLTYGLCSCVGAGFTVQVAQLIGAGKLDEAQDVHRQSIVVCAIASLALTLASVAISWSLPAWMGGDPTIYSDATGYFLAFSLGLPAGMFARLATGMLQCSGDMRTPSILNGASCLLDIVFNLLLIFPTSTYVVLGLPITIPGAGLGVTGAAVGSVLAQLVVGIILMWCSCVRSATLNLRDHGSWLLRARCLKTALRIAAPMFLERFITNGAQIATTMIVAPLKTTSVAAHSLAITAEGVCYMPGFGVGAAATTLVGQAIGARRKDVALDFAKLSTLLGMALMAGTGLLLFVFAPQVMALLTPDPAVRELGCAVLRIEAFAEPFFGASIVATGALRGAGDTLIPSIISFTSVWVIRITAAAALAPLLGLRGVWIAMCGELIIRGIIFLVRLWRAKWLERKDLAGR